MVKLSHRILLGACLALGLSAFAEDPLIPSPSAPLPFNPSEAAAPRAMPRELAAPSVIFRGEFSKPEIYAGEQVMVNYVVYSQEDVLDIEVAKFPEFRGYWSENFSLRQGPIPLMGGGFLGNSFETQWKKAVLGSYLIAPMLGKDSPQLLPMKIIIRRAMEMREDGMPIGESHDCAYEPLKIKPLPPLPSSFDPSSFPGAVGNFNLIAENVEIPYEKDEPTTLRITLQGEGNFQEVNRLPFPKEEGVEVLASRATLQGSGQYTRKTYETTLRVHREANFSLPSYPIVFFNPSSARYLALTVPSLSFRYVPTPPEPKAMSDEPLFVHAADETPSLVHPSARSGRFWLFQLIALFGAVAFVLSRLIPLWRERRLQSPEYHRKRRWEEAKEARRSGNADHFLRLADQLALELLAAQLRLPRHVTRQRALMVAEKTGDAELVRHARRLFDAYEQLHYSPSHAQPESLDALEDSLQYLLHHRKHAAA